MCGGGGGGGGGGVVSGGGGGGGGVGWVGGWVGGGGGGGGGGGWGGGGIFCDPFDLSEPKEIILASNTNLYDNYVWKQFYVFQRIHSFDLQPS